MLSRKSGHFTDDTRRWSCFRRSISTSCGTPARGQTSFTYLRYGPFASKEALAGLIADLSAREDQPFWAIRPLNSGKAAGWLSLCDIYPVDASIEIGSIWFAPGLQRSRAAREALFMLMQFGRIGIVLLLPSMALHVVTGMGIHTCILLMGVLCILYTVLGGIEAVIWTDVLQVVVLAGGAVLCLVLMAVRHEGGWDAMVSAADVAGKFRTFDFRFDLTDPVFLVVVLGGFGNSLVSYGSDQAISESP